MQPRDCPFKWPVSMLMAVLLCVAIAAHARADDIKIGAVLHLTGDLAMQSGAFREGLELAIAEVNRSVNPLHTLKLVVEDGRNNSHSSHSAALKLLTSDKVHAAIISSHLDAMSAGPLFERAKVPAIVIWDSNPEIDAIGGYIFAIGPWTPSCGESAARFAANALRARRAVIVKSQDPFSEYAAAHFERTFTSLGGRVLERYVLNAGDSDFRSVITRAKALQPDLFYTPIVYQLVAFYRRLYEQRVGVPIISADVINEEHIARAPQAFEGIYQSIMPREPDSPVYPRLVSAYRAKYGRELKLGWYTAVAYDAVMLIARAITTDGAQPQHIARGLYRIKNFPGASAVLSINASGSAPQYEVIHRIHAGRLERVAAN